jgi:hypothetical protein
MDKELAMQLTNAAKAMSRANALIKEGEEIKKSVKSEVLPLMESFDVKNHVVEGLGNLGYREGGGSSINPTKLAEILLSEGVEANRIPGIIEGSKKTWSYSYIEFKREKRG